MKEENWNEGTKEREILAAMVMRAPVLSRLAPLAGEKGEWKLFVSPDANRIASWCIEHWRKYGKPPKKAIGSYMAAWVEQSQPVEEVQDMTSRLLTVCSEEYERKDDDWMIDRAGEHFRTVTARRLKDDIEALLETGDIDKAEERIAKHSRIELGGSSMTDPFTDREDHKSIFAKESLDNLVDYPGAMGKFFRNTFHRGAFVAFCAPQKTYKSTFLVDLAWRAMVFHQRKVAYFEIGDFTEREIKEKFAVRNARHPSLTDDAWPMTVEVPTDISIADENEIATVRSEKRTFAAPLDFDTSWEACLKTMNEKVKSNTSRFRMATYGNLAISALGIKELLERLDRDGFTADVVCIAEGSLVLTDRGLVPIEQIQPNDKLWDGSDWVHHGGLVYKGERDVISYAGLTATPEHQVWTEEGWRTFESCAQMGLRIAQTGIGGENIRIGESYISQTSGSINTKQEEGIHLCKMCTMWIKKMDNVVQSSKRNRKGMSFLSSTEEISNLVLSPLDGNSGAMRESIPSSLEGLWRSGDSILLPFGIRSMFVDSREFRDREQETFTIGSNRQRWSLRTGESAMVNKKTEHVAYEKNERNGKSTQIPHSLSKCQICRRDFVGFLEQAKNDSVGNHPKMESEPRRVPVWDIRNAGPFHRFTVQGLLVHNCIDYADQLAPVDKREETRDRVHTTWKHLRALALERHCLVVTATQVNAAGFKAKWLDRIHFSEDNRKLNLVSGLVGINANDEERRKGICRLKWIVKRRGHPAPPIWLAQCLPLGNPCVKSCFCEKTGRK